MRLKLVLLAGSLPLMIPQSRIRPGASLECGVAEARSPPGDTGPRPQPSPWHGPRITAGKAWR